MDILNEYYIISQFKQMYHNADILKWMFLYKINCAYRLQAAERKIDVKVRNMGY